MKDLFQTIAEFHARTEGYGWCDLEKVYALANLVLALKPEVVCEIGIYAGRSFLPMALACNYNKSGVVIGIEPWSKEAATAGYEGENLQFWENMDYKMIRDKFFREIDTYCLNSNIRIEEVRSDDFTPIVTDILHLDGQHTIQAIRDVQRFCPCVCLGGIVVMDDITWSNAGDQPVIRACEWLEQNGFVKLYPLGTGAVYQRLQ